MHLRYRLGRNLFGDDVHDQARRAAATSGNCSPTWSRCNTSAPAAISIAARSACAATSSRFSRRTTRTAPGACRCSATRWNRSTNSIRSPAQKTDELEFVKIYANSHYVTPRPTLLQAISGIKFELRAAPRSAQRRRPAAGSAAARAAHALRSGNDGGDRRLRRHRELFALSHRPQARRAAADLVRIRARQRAGVRRREPRHRAAARRHVSRRLPPQGDARRIRLPPAVLHGQPAAALRGMGRDAAADHVRLGDAGAVGDQRIRRRVRRAGDPPDRADRSAGRHAAGAHPGRRSGRRSARRWRSRATARWSPC